MEQQNVQGWQPDPFGVHEERYFSGGDPTKLVRDGDTESYDDIPGQEPAPGDEPAVAAGPGTAADAATGMPGAASTETPASGTPARDGDTGAPPSDTGALPGEPEPAEPASAASVRTSTPGSAATSGSAAAVGSLAAAGGALAGRARRRPRVSAGIALVAAAAVAGIAALAGGFSSSAPDLSIWNGTGSQAGAGGGSASLGMAPAAFVPAAAQRTLARKSAAVTLTGTVGGSGRLLAMHGTGRVDLARNEAAFSLRASYSGSTITENDFLTSKDVFLEVAQDGKPWNVGGHHWIEFPLAQSLASSVPLQSPAWSLELLEQHGAQVAAARTENIAGLSCTQFTVQPTHQAMLTAAGQQEFAEGGLTRPQQTAARQALRSATPPTLTISFDPRRQLACQMNVSMPLTTDPAPPSGTAQSIQFVPMQITFTRYGVPAHLTPPAASDAVLF